MRGLCRIPRRGRRLQSRGAYRIKFWPHRYLEALRYVICILAFGWDRKFFLVKIFLKAAGDLRLFYSVEFCSGGLAVCAAEILLG